MSGERHDDITLDAYCDGLLDDAQRAAFEQRLADDPDLRAELELQQQIDARLRRRFAPPAAEAFAARVRRDAGAATGRKTRSSMPALAAAIVLALLGGGLWWQFGRGPEKNWTANPHALAEVMRFERAEGFKPNWRCRTDLEFAKTFNDRLGQPLLLKEMPETIEALGLSYAYTLSPETTHMLVRVDGREAIVFVDRAERDTQPELSSWTGLKLHRVELDQLVLYELSPFDAPRVLPYFFNPPVSEAWLRGELGTDRP